LTSRTTHRFREAYGRLPEHVRRRAREAYRRFKSDPRHPSLRFKQVHATEPIYAARVGLGYRALAVLDGEILPIAEAEFAGPLPPELQAYVVFTVGIARNAKDAEAAKTFINFFRTPAVLLMLKAKGMEPG